MCPHKQVAIVQSAKKILANHIIRISYNVHGLDYDGIRFIYLYLKAVYCYFNLKLMVMIEHFHLCLESSFTNFGSYNFSEGSWMR